jgi:hypothetical protein
MILGSPDFSVRELEYIGYELLGSKIISKSQRPKETYLISHLY